MVAKRCIALDLNKSRLFLVHKQKQSPQRDCCLRMHMAFRMGQTVNLKQGWRHLAKDQGHSKPYESIFSYSEEENARDGGTSSVPG